MIPASYPPRLKKPRWTIFFLALTVLILDASALKAETPKNVKCAILAQEKARNEGADYQRIYNRNFELCMLRAMPRERQTQYLIEKLKPYVAISPGLKEVSPSQDEAKFAGRWVRISPYMWVLED